MNEMKVQRFKVRSKTNYGLV